MSLAFRHHLAFNNMTDSCMCYIVIRACFPVFGPQCTCSSKHKIQVKEGSQPVRLLMYRYSDEKKQIMQDQVEKMLWHWLIEPTSSPVVIVKKDTTPHSQRLNKQVDSPLPLIYVTIKDLSGAEVLPTLDMKSRYWQISLDEAEKRSTQHSQWQMEVITSSGSCGLNWRTSQDLPVFDAGCANRGFSGSVTSSTLTIASSTPRLGNTYGTMIKSWRG